MDLAFTYVAYSNLLNQKVDGAIVATSQENAYRQLNQQLGLTRISLRMNLSFTLSWWLSPHYPEEEIAQFYRSYYDQMQIYPNEQDVLKSIYEFTLNPFLRTIILQMIIGRKAGELFGDVMIKVGLPKDEAQILLALEKSSSNFVDTFKSLAEQKQASYELSKDFQGIFRTPLITVALVYFAVVYVAVYVSGPSMIRINQLMGSNVKVLPVIKLYLDGVTWLYQHPYLFWPVFIGLPIACFFASRTALFKRLIMKNPTLKLYLEQREYARFWSAYRLLNAVPVPPQLICMQLLPSLNLDSSRATVMRFSRSLKAGNEEVKAIADANFPSWVKNGVSGAFRSGDIGGVLDRQVQIWRKQTTWLAEKLKAKVNSLMVLIQGFAALIIVFILDVLPALNTLVNV